MISHLDLTKKGFERFIENHHVTRGKVLDVGCRDAGLYQWLTDLQFEWHGCDRSSQEKTKSGVKDVLYCDMHSLDMYPDNYFDVVFSCHSFEHVENPSQVLREFKRVLKAGGWCFIAMPIFGEKYIVKADNDHISILHRWQMERLCKYTDAFDLIEHHIDHMNGENTTSEQDNQLYILRVKK